MGKSYARCWGLTIGFAALAGLALVSSAPAPALEPAPARIVFSNGGRIVAINADGHGRHVIAWRLKKVENTDFGYQEPSLSPDGSRIVFLDRRPSREYGYLENIMVMNADGTGMVKVLQGDGMNFFRAPSWTPDGEQILAGYSWRRGKGSGIKQRGGIVSVKPDGSNWKIIYKPKKFRDRAGYPVTPRPDHPVMSPDGTKILFDDRDKQTDGRLKILDLATGKTKAIARYSLGASWSPDGSKVVYSRNNTGDDEVCGSVDCEESGELFIIDADGSGARNLLPGKGHEMSPDWSDDGTRIVFSGNRNMPTSSDAFEVYSVKPDGKCLAWLTNGTPASLSPSWSSSYTDPGSCGDNGLELLPEVVLEPKVRGLEVHNWMGDDFRGQLFSGRSGPEPGEAVTILNYADCSHFEPKLCGAGFETIELSVCPARGSVASLFALVGGTKARGVPTFSGSGDGTTQIGAFTGESLLLIWHETNNRFFSKRELLRGIRPFGSTTNPRKLPPPVFPARTIRNMKKVVRVHKRTGSVKRTAEVLGMTRGRVTLNLFFRRELRRFGPIHTVKCPK